MFLCGVQVAAGSQASWLAKVTLSVSCFCLSQRDPAKVGELLVLQLPCKHSNKGCEGREDGKHYSQWLEGRGFESRERGYHTKTPLYPLRHELL